MALTAGSVTIAADGTETKSGAAQTYYDLIKAQMAPLLPGGAEPADGAAKAPIRKAWAALANVLASGLVTELTTNAKARVGGAVAGLQKTPNPNNPNTATVAHGGADIDLPIV